MDIPELLQTIGRYLDNNSLASCVRVCLTWHQIFIPCLYNTIESQRTSIEGLTRHAHHIRHLDLSMDSKGYLDMYTPLRSECHNLLRLVVSCNDDSYENNDLYWNAVDFVLANRSLRTLTIFDREPNVYRPCWKLMFTQCPQSLRELHLTSVKLHSEEETTQLMLLAGSLTTLVLKGCCAIWSDSFTADPQFPLIEHLEIHDMFDTTAQELKWIQQCPSLKCLRWGNEMSGRSTHSDATVFKSLNTPTWPLLQELTLQSLNIDMSDRQVSWLLEACGPLRKFAIASSGFWYRSFRSLERHFETLEELRLDSCRDLRSFMSQRILTSCPRLIHLALPVLEGHELVEGTKGMEARSRRLEEDARTDLRKKEQDEAAADVDENPTELNTIIASYSVRDLGQVRPWVCKGLLYLKMFITFTLPFPSGTEDDDCDDWDEIVFQQLSQLTELQTLDVSDTSFHPENLWVTWRNPQFKLQSGLAKLAPITRLQFLLFDDTVQCLDVEDLRWIMDHFSHLEQISPVLHLEDEICDELLKIVEEKGIRTCEDRSP
ncbi:hypothetical protein EMPS_09875 [Entomortierella parvispora]|uniref:F-box domain-containing protein n=1 Tax=Entomortierella parvispora TaxID=205924 RepID=A0A9P3M0F9_9FUNG|nr:hypothetical protein EMPS_09875 [Entomortierella parvispora]